ncbi:MAG: AAA family ATPase, partial [Tolypothrix sp. Co-bin9]|nr:AAA family ATPase [Tolypothrix sp. Co-bin9]
MVDWNPYLESICKKYAQWWDTYTLTNVVGNKYDQKVRKSLLLDLQAIALKPETVKPQREQFPEAREEREVFNVLEGLRKYAPEHVLLTGRPGSGKSTALVRLLLESAQNHLEINFQANSESRLKTTESSGASQLKLTSAMRQGIDSLTDLAENKQIPILVELRYYTTSILDLIRDFLKRHQLWLEISEIEKLLFEGQLLLLVDGVNELPSQEAQRNLQKFRQDYQQTTPMVFT